MSSPVSDRNKKEGSENSGSSKTCDICSGETIFTTSHKYGVTRNAYFCETCIAFVGCHVGTDEPLGTMAKPNVRKLRKQLHKIADPFWMEGLITRDHMYVLLSAHLEMDGAHVGILDEEQLLSAITFFTEYEETHKKYLIRRKVKRNAKRTKSRNRSRTD